MSTGKLVGYGRVSTDDQDLAIQIEALKSAGCAKIFSEKKSGTGASNRPALQEMMDFIREDDIVIVHRLDRFARSQVDLHNLIATLQSKRVGFRCLTQPIDTTTSMGMLIVGVLGAVAEFETALRKERQMDGIAKAKKAGVYGGRKPSIDRARIATLRAQGMGATEIAKELGIARGSVYRIEAGS